MVGHRHLRLCECFLHFRGYTPAQVTALDDEGNLCRAMEGRTPKRHLTLPLVDPAKVKGLRVLIQ